jgi:DNA-binding NarL/FixJ family response regulator
MKVVIADDHRIVREGITWMLSDAPGIDIEGEADSGEALLELLATTPADVALVDVRMEGMSGLDALERIKAEFPQVQVIILSMHDQPAYVRRAIELGASGYLLKSTGRDELIRALEAVASGGAYLQGEVVAPLITEVKEGTEPARLSPREHEVLQLVAQGYENKQIATELEIAEATVKTYLRGIFERLDVSSRAEAVAVGLREGLIE